MLILRMTRSRQLSMGSPRYGDTVIVKRPDGFHTFSDGLFVLAFTFDTVRPCTGVLSMQRFGFLGPPLIPDVSMIPPHRD